MKYSVSTIVRAAVAGVLGAAGAAATSGHGVDVAELDIGQWLTMLGTGLVSAGALLHPTVRGTANDHARASMQDVVTKASEAHEKLTRQAVESIERVKAAVGDLSSVLPQSAPAPAPLKVPDLPQFEVLPWRPPLGPLAQQMLDTVTTAADNAVGAGR
ncbi:hypothetical protein [Mycobacterium canetti]|uniref:hypothetical protein n=1 Tax=Mycobacterium canetti TaxID=78331 RepID=UPI001E565341|nr:hypothetical protein [Mycobacterium canetti]